MLFNSDGKIGKLTTAANVASGVSTNFTYKTASSGVTSPVAVNILKSVQAGSHSLSFNYSQIPKTNTPLLTSVVDENGRIATLQYGNCFGQITLATSLPGLCGATKPDWVKGNAWTYTFGFGQPAIGIGAQALLLNGVYIINPMQNGLSKTAIAYDGARAIPTAVTDANSHTTTYYVAPGRSSVTDAVGNTSYSVTYPQTQLTDIIVTDSYDSLGNRTELQYNYAGQLIDKLLPNTQYGYQYAYTYDAHGNLASTAIGPTANNQQILTSTLWDQTWNKPHVVTDAVGNVTTYNYNAGTGTLTNVVHPAVTYLGNTVQPAESYTYNSNGQVNTATAADGEMTCYSYSPTVYDLIGVIVDCGSSPHLNLTTRLGYTNVGDVNQILSARGYTTGINYDLARRPYHENTPPIAAQGNGVWSTYQHYDLDGRLIETDQDPGTGQALVATKITYDPVGNKLTQSQPTNSGVVHNTVYTYDADERLSTVTIPVSDTASQTTTRTYDADSRLYQVFAGSKLTETHLYNGDSLPCEVGDGIAALSICQTGRVPHATTYTYDLYDRLTKTTYSDGTNEQLTLDKAGRVVSWLNRGQNPTSFSYDALNRVLVEIVGGFSAPFTTTYDLGNRPLTVTYSDGTFNYAYDSAGRQKQTTRPDGKVTGYGYDADGNTASIIYPDTYTYNYGYDELDRMTDVFEIAPGSTTSSNLAHYAYDPLSRRTSLAYGNNTNSAYGYDPFSGLASITHTFTPNSVVPAITYSYTRDYSERRQTDTVSFSGYLWHPPAAGTTTYKPNGLNEYASINGQTLSYDPNGNLLNDPTASLGTAAYQFDPLNRLTSATNAQHSASYTYDAFSRRRDKTVDNSTTVYVDDGNRTIADYNPEGAEIQHYIYGADTAPIASEYFGGKAAYSQFRYYYTDALGSVVFMADKYGKATDSFTYSPFGEGISSTSTTYRYAGMRLDAETMLYYDNARYYSPQQGRFLSPDPIGAEGGVNIYAYAANDPLNGVDLTGLAYSEGDGSDPFGGACNICIIGNQTLFFGGDFSYHGGGDVYQTTVNPDGSGNTVDVTTGETISTTTIIGAATIGSTADTTVSADEGQPSISGVQFAGSEGPDDHPNQTLTNNGEVGGITNLTVTAVRRSTASQGTFQFGLGGGFDTPVGFGGVGSLTLAFDTHGGISILLTLGGGRGNYSRVLAGYGGIAFAGSNAHDVSDLPGPFLNGSASYRGYSIDAFSGQSEHGIVTGAGGTFGFGFGFGAFGGLTQTLSLVQVR